ncbi:hypothetical protein KEM55_002999, partial [Ascosphaera atra]
RLLIKALNPTLEPLRTAWTQQAQSTKTFSAADGREYSWSTDARQSTITAFSTTFEMAKERTGLIYGLNKGHKTTPHASKPRISRTKGHLSRRTAFVREVVKEVAGLAPYERRVV